MMRTNKMKYLLGLLLTLGSILPASAQSSGDGYSPGNPTEPGDPATLLKYKVTTVANIAGAGTLSGGGTFQYGTSTTVKATANSGYKFLKWLKDDDTTTEYRTSSSFSHTVEADVKFTAVFEKAKKITVGINDSNAGTVSGSGTAFYKGSTQTISTTPKTNYQFRYWLKNDETEPYNTNASFSYTMEDEDVTFTAVYEYVEPPYTPSNPGEPNVEAEKMVSYKVSALLSDPDAGITTGSGKYPWGTSVSISTSPNAGWEFRKWLKGEDEYSTATSFNYTIVAEDVEFTAVYEWVGIPEPEPTSHKLYLIASAEGSCTFSMANGSDVNIGSSFNVTATLGTGFVFAGWYKGSELVGSNTTYSGTMGQENIVLTANCIYTPSSPDDPGAATDDGTYVDKRRKVTVLSVNEKRGTVSTVGISAGGVALAEKNVTLTASEKDGYTFGGWSDGQGIVSTENPYSFEVENNITLVAMFQAPLTTKLGDADNSGEVDVTDITAVVSHIYGNTPNNFNEVAADVNGDTDIDVTDITGIVTIIYSGAGNEPQGVKGKVKAGATIMASSMSVNAGQTIELPIYFSNMNAYSSLQFDLKLPKGVKVESTSMSPAMTTGHDCMAEYVGNAYRVMSYSMSNRRFQDPSAEPIMVVTLKADEDMQDGLYNIEIVNAAVSTIGEKIKPTIQCGQLMVGDATGINTIREQNASQAYSLTGIRVAAPQGKGIYIINGKKHIK